MSPETKEKKSRKKKKARVTLEGMTAGDVMKRVYALRQGLLDNARHVIGTHSEPTFLELNGIL